MASKKRLAVDGFSFGYRSLISLLLFNCNSALLHLSRQLLHLGHFAATAKLEERPLAPVALNSDHKTLWVDIEFLLRHNKAVCTNLARVFNESRQAPQP
jgi:hypothetical protein